MKNFAIFLEANNFIVADGDSFKVVGFFVTKRVEASTADEAAAMAVKAILSDQKFSQGPPSSSEPSVVVKVVQELPTSNKMKDTEYVYF